MNLPEAPSHALQPCWTPRELEATLLQLRGQQARAPWPADLLEALGAALEAFCAQWAAASERFGLAPAGELSRRDAWLGLVEALDRLDRAQLEGVASSSPTLSGLIDQARAVAPRSRLSLRSMVRAGPGRASPLPTRTRPALQAFDRPIFIVSAPRSGSTLLFEALSELPTVWTTGMESHGLEADIPWLHPAAHAFESNRLTGCDASPAAAEQVAQWFLARLQNPQRVRWAALEAGVRPEPVRFLEKTPKNALRIPFLRTIFPDAMFLFLYRQPQPCIASLLEGWRSRQFVAYRDLPGWPHREWSFLLVPGWRNLANRSLVEVVAEQWRRTNTMILDDLEALPSSSWCFLRYETLIQHPAKTLDEVQRFCGLLSSSEPMTQATEPLPIARQSISPPSPDKWQKYANEIEPVVETLEPIKQRILSLIETHRRGD